MQALLVADDALIRNTGGGVLVALLVARVYPYGVHFCTVVPNKWVNEAVVRRLARFITVRGLVQFPYGSDREPSIAAMIQKACRLSGREGRNISKPSQAALGNANRETQTFELT